MQLPWCIYQTRTVKETKKLTSQLLEVKISRENNGILHEDSTNRLCCAKNELTKGLVYTE